ncbi:MAG: sigma 54-interacting transcriptional regulator [Rhizobiaceae bacterium]|nr:sigma 54-interacting transcriptional regulator [Rhizobiaceae bacterium]
MDAASRSGDTLDELCRLASADGWTSALETACGLLKHAASGENAFLFLTDITGQAVELAAAQIRGREHRILEELRVVIDPTVNDTCPMVQVAQLGRLLSIADHSHGYDFSRIETLIAPPSRGRRMLFIPLRGMRRPGFFGIAVVTGIETASDLGPNTNALLKAICDLLDLYLTNGRQAAELRSLRHRAESEEREKRETRQRQAARIEARLVGNSALISSARDRVAQFAATEHPVLILGEQGSGKERAAREIHGLSKRRNATFVYFDCASVPPLALVSELSGYKRGAIPGQAAARRGLLREAAGGTLYLDRVDLVPPEAQMFLGRLLETGVYRALGSERDMPSDARLIFAALPDFVQRAEAGTFLPSLSFALLRYVLKVPSLEERRQDIGPVVEAILARVSAPGGDTLELSNGALAVLHALDYPGNLRQLESLVERAIDLAADGEKALTSAHIEAARNVDVGVSPVASEGLREAVARFEADLVRRALNLSSGDRARAAELLQIPKRTLADKCIRYAL